MTLGDLDLLVLGVAGEPDDLHPVHERLRHAERVRRGHEQHVRQVVVDLEIVVVEGVVLLGIEHFEQRRGGIAAPIGAELVDLVQQEQRVGRLGLLHALDDLARHRADIGAAVAADLGLVAHPAERHADEVAPRRTGDRLAERGLADAGRADQAEDRALHLAHALLHGEIFDDSLLDLLQPVMVLVQHALGAAEVALDLGALFPRDVEQPVEVIADHRRLGRHRAHRAQLLELLERLLARLLRQLGLLDALLDLAGLVAAVLALAELLLDRLELLVEIVLALRLLHLPLDAVADALLDLQDADLALHERVGALQPLLDADRLQQLLLFRDLQREMRGDGIGELAGILDLIKGNKNFRRDFLVQLYILLELLDHRARERLQLVRILGRVVDRLGFRLEIVLGLGEFDDLRAPRPLDQHLHRAVRQLEQLQHGADGAERVDVFRRGIVLARVLLCDQQDLLVVLHHVLERPHRLLAPDEERHDHVREDDDVPQRKERENWTRGI